MTQEQTLLTIFIIMPIAYVFGQFVGLGILYWYVNRRE